MKKWKILHKQTPKTNQELVDILLTNRKISEEDKDQFLNPSLSNITPETVGIDTKQLSKAVKRVEQAIKKNENIIIFGDYDADGICATTILWETIYRQTKISAELRQKMENTPQTNSKD